MKKLKLSFMCLFLLVTCITLALANAQAQTPQATLNQCVADLQKNPNDYALREKIIRHVQAMKQKPAIPEEARRHFIEGNTLLKAAKDQRSYGLARDAYRQCLLVAPWWGDAYNNYAVALELSGQFDDAVNALKLYIATNPGEGETRKAQDKIYEIGAKKKLAAQEKESSPPKAASAPPQNAFEDLLRKIDGRRYTCPIEACSMVIDVRGKVFIMGNLCPQNHDVPDFRGYVEGFRDEIRGRETTVPIYNQPAHLRVRAVSKTYVISDDGDRITYRIRYNDGDVRQYIFLWQR